MTITDQTFTWPGGAAVAVSFTFDVDAESGFIGDGEHYRRRLTTMSEGRFGVVRGMPRILDLLQQYGIAGSFYVPGYTAELYPDVVERLVDSPHEIAHHGYLHKRNDTCTPEELREEIERGIDALVEAGAPRPVGYRSPAWEMTSETFDLLVEHGFLYDSSCMGDDRPYVERWEGGRILEVPVHWSLDDWPRFGWSIDNGGNVADAGELFSSWAEEYRAARAEGRQVTFTMHPEVIGRSYRLAALERLIEHMTADNDVWFATVEQVARHVQADLMGTAAA